MKSPLSHDPMLVLELSGVEIDYCPFTEGIWLDSGELEELLGDTKAAEALLATFKLDEKCREERVRCPICRKKMEKVTVEDKLTIDRCRNGHGLWFDEGELLEILKMQHSGNSQKVVKLLEDMFAHNINNTSSKP